jgi:protein-tyrosine phosphatase
MHTDASPSRHLPWDGCYNIRDVGGYATTDGGQIRWGALVRADNLCRLSPAGSAALIDHGIRTIIDLRSASELAYAPHPFASAQGEPDTLVYQHLSLLDEADLDGVARIDNASSVGEMYTLMLDQYPAQIATIIRAVAYAREGGVLVHCFIGKDRTGVIVALLLAVAGAEPTMIVADYAESDNYLQPLYVEVLESLAHDLPRQRQLASLLASPPAAMQMALAHLDANYGGPLGYLQAIGVDQQEILLLRQRLRQTQV